MRYVHEVDPPTGFVPAAMRIGLMQQNCAYEGLTSMIDAGAVIRHVYLRKDGTEIGGGEVPKGACGR